MGYQAAGAGELRCFFCLGQWSAGEVKLWSYYQLEDFQINMYSHKQQCFLPGSFLLYRVHGGANCLPCHQTARGMNGFRVRYISAQILYQPRPCPAAQPPRRKEALRVKGSISHTRDQASLCPSPFPLISLCRCLGAPSTHTHPVPTTGQVWCPPWERPGKQKQPQLLSSRGSAWLILTRGKRGNGRCIQLPPWRGNEPDRALSLFQRYALLLQTTGIT